MGNACSCVKRQAPKTRGRTSGDTVTPAANGTVTQTENAGQRRSVASNTSPAAHAALPSSRRIVVVNRSGAHALIQRQHVQDAAGRGTVVVVTSQRRPDLKTLILDTLRLIRSLTAKLVLITLS
jgi:hypothetical protein